MKRLLVLAVLVSCGPAVLRGLLQNGYQAAMRPSPPVARLRQMKQPLDRGEEPFERKLRYLFWLN